VHTDCKLHFHCHVDFLFPRALKLLELIRTITFSFSTSGSLLKPYFAFLRPRLHSASATWNSVTITDSNKLERIQRKFAAVCHTRFSQDMEYHYDNLLERLNFLKLYNKRRHPGALFLINVLSFTKCCPCVLEAVGLWVRTPNIRNFNMFTCSSSHCPSPTCVSTENADCKITDIFRNSCLSVKSLN
jgi:hypothetical protein